VINNCWHPLGKFIGFATVSDPSGDTVFTCDAKHPIQFISDDGVVFTIVKLSTGNMFCLLFSSEPNREVNFGLSWLFIDSACVSIIK
jgi:hypothetical protein